MPIKGPNSGSSAHGWYRVPNTDFPHFRLEDNDTYNFDNISSMPASSKPQIAIIGAGPGGLLLARYLQRNSIPCKIYERETSRHHRTQGGSLDLHEESGLLAMKEAGLMEEFTKFARTEGEQMKIFDRTGKLWFDDEENEEGAGHGRPEIDR
jgi:hypothetical protein